MDAKREKAAEEWVQTAGRSKGMHGKGVDEGWLCSAGLLHAAQAGCGMLVRQDASRVQLMSGAVGADCPPSLEPSSERIQVLLCVPETTHVRWDAAAVVLQGWIEVVDRGAKCKVGMYL